MSHPRISKEKTDALQAILDQLREGIAKDDTPLVQDAILELQDFIDDCGFRKGDWAE